MSQETPEPPTMRTVGSCEIQGAGFRWDAVRVPRSLGARVLVALGSRSGAVIEDPREPALYWFVRTGTAAVWDVPDTRPLGLSQHLVVPPPHRMRGPGPHWRICPENGQMLTDAQVLHAAVEGVTAPLRAPVTETT